MSNHESNEQFFKRLARDTVVGYLIFSALYIVVSWIFS